MCIISIFINSRCLVFCVVRVQMTLVNYDVNNHDHNHTSLLTGLPMNLKCYIGLARYTANFGNETSTRKFENFPLPNGGEFSS